MNFRKECEEEEFWASEIAMNPLTSVLVEGESDVLLYSKFLNLSLCSIEEMRGKEKLLKIMEILDNIKSKTKRTIAIVDADLDHLTQTTYNPNILLTDTHDAEIMMFFSSAFERVIKEYFKKEKCNTQEEIEATRNKLINLSIPMAAMRIFDKNNNLHFSFKPNYDTEKDFPYAKFINAKSNILEFINIEKMVSTTCSYHGNQGQTINQKEAVEEIKEILSKKYPIHFILHGHDIMHIMELSLKSYGKKTKQKKTFDDFETSFRLTYTLEDFSQTTLYQNLLNFSYKINVPFVITK